MDNARIHHGNEIVELVEQHGMPWFVNRSIIENHGDRCTSCISSPLFSWSQTYWGGFLKDQGMDLTQQWHLFGCNWGRSHVWYARSVEHNHGIRCNWVLYTCRLFVVLLPLVSIRCIHVWSTVFTRAKGRNEFRISENDCGAKNGWQKAGNKQA